jgi:hypothetical protein
MAEKAWKMFCGAIRPLLGNKISWQSWEPAFWGRLEPDRLACEQWARHVRDVAVTGVDVVPGPEPLQRAQKLSLFEKLNAGLNISPSPELDAAPLLRKLQALPHDVLAKIAKSPADAALLQELPLRERYLAAAYAEYPEMTDATGDMGVHWKAAKGDLDNLVELARRGDTLSTMVCYIRDQGIPINWRQLARDFLREDRVATEISWLKSFGGEYVL